MSRDFKVFMIGFLIANILYLWGYARLENKHAVDISFVEMGGLIK